MEGIMLVIGGQATAGLEELPAAVSPRRHVVASRDPGRARRRRIRAIAEGCYGSVVSNPSRSNRAVNARAVNVAILVLLAFELATGLGSFLAGDPDGRWLFWSPRAGGLALLVLLIGKAGIAARSYRRRGVTVGTGLSAVGGPVF